MLTGVLTSVFFSTDFVSVFVSSSVIAHFNHAGTSSFFVSVEAKGSSIVLGSLDLELSANGSFTSFTSFSKLPKISEASSITGAATGLGHFSQEVLLIIKSWNPSLSSLFAKI